MKSLVQFIREAKKESGSSTWGVVFERMLDVDGGKITEADFDEVQHDDWIWDDATGDVAETKFLMELYTEFKDEKVKWEAEDITNAIAYKISDKKGHAISFDAMEMIKF